MKNAELFHVPTKSAPGYAWKWRCVSSEVESAKSFEFYYDCFSDARMHGYHVELTRASGISAPGGAGCQMP